MWNETIKRRLKALPRLYETEHVPLKDKLVLIVRVLKISSENFAKEVGRTYLAEQ